MMSVRAPESSAKFDQRRTIWPAALFLFLSPLRGKFTHLTILQYLFSSLSYMVIYPIGFLRADFNRFLSPLPQWRWVVRLRKAEASQARPRQCPSALAFNTVVIPVMSLSLKLQLPTLFKCVVVFCCGQRATETEAGSTKLISWPNADSFNHNSP